MTTDSAAAAGAAMKASAAINRTQQEMTEESRTLLVALIRGEMKTAVADGIKEAMTDEAAERLFNKFFDVMRKQATEKTGTFVLGGLSAVARRLMWALVFIAAVYMLGGWSAITTGLKVLKAGAS
jgi:hypothetical protein